MLWVTESSLYTKLSEGEKKRNSQNIKKMGGAGIQSGKGLLFKKNGGDYQGETT